LQHSLELEPDPRSVTAARRWMRGLMREVGHEELSETAELATSELVTNAVLHARTEISIVVNIEGADVWVEIRDGSRAGLSAPVPRYVEADADPVTVPSVGNGLLILGAVTRRWGVREEPGVGKAVWFIPAPRSGDPHPPSTHTKNQARGGEDAVAVTLLHAPVILLWTEMSRCRDLARELSLLRLANSHDDLTAIAERFLLTYVTDEDGWQALHDAYRQGRSSVPLRIRVERSRAAQIPGFGELLAQLDELSRTGELLTVPATAPARAVRTWVLGEIERQVAGASPQPWHS
jgi:anti-sigma regulatory factor (Ser/Thr protein kinase)